MANHHSPSYYSGGLQYPSTPSTSLSRESFSNPLFLESSPPLCHTQLPENLVISEVDGIKYGKYEKAYHSDFMDWWRQTPVGTAINNGKIDEKLQHPHWDRNRKRGDLWDQFDQLAELHTGKPVLQCLTCRSIIQHGIHHNNGTSGMNKHLRSKDCKGKQTPDSRQSIITVNVSCILFLVCTDSLSGNHAIKGKGLILNYRTTP
jgi:hypothetical protein